MDELHAVVAHDVEDEVPSRRSGHRLLRLLAWLVVLAILAVGIALVLDTSLITTFAAVLLGGLILRAGWFFLQTVATPPPPPPAPGTIRKVKLVYRCSVCGAEVRMTAAPTEDPEPPRHCFEDMDLVAPIE